MEIESRETENESKHFSNFGLHIDVIDTFHYSFCVHMNSILVS